VTTPESYVLKAILDYLAAERIFALRMNVGALQYNSKGRIRTVNFGLVGQADILAFPILDYGPHPLWLECKSEKGKQSAEQKSFEEHVRKHMHTYAVVRSIDDVKAVLERIGYVS
jgi:hypothetical protein